jgi:hypothetical protein
MIWSALISDDTVGQRNNYVTAALANDGRSNNRKRCSLPLDS